MSTTDYLNYLVLQQKMALLKELHTEFKKPDSDWDMDNPNGLRNRYIEVRKDVSISLIPLFQYLNQTGMLVLFTKGNAKTYQETIDDPTKKLNRIETLEFDGANSGLQFSVNE